MKRKQVYKRKRTVKRPVNQGALALKMVKTLKRTVKPEVKWMPFEEDIGVSETGYLRDFHSGINVGAGVNQRIGDTVKPLRVVGRMLCEISPVESTALSQMVRVIFFRGKQENGIYPTANTYLQPTAGQLCLAAKNPDNSNHYSVIYDKMYSLSLGGKSNYVLNYNFPLSGMVKWERNSDSVIETGGIYILIITNQGTILPRVSYNFRLYYTDT